MKKSLLLFSTLLLAGAAFSQPATESELAKYKAKLEKSDKEVADAGKASNPKTWLKRYDLLTEIDESTTKGAMPGLPKEQAILVVGKPLKEYKETINNTNYEVLEYYACALYFDKGVLVFTKTKNSAVADPLLLALKSVDEAVKADTKNDAGKRILESYVDLNKRLRASGLNYYFGGDMQNAATYFSAAADCAARPTVGNVDSMMTYYAGFALLNLGKHKEAAEYFKRSIAISYFGDKDGIVFRNLSACYQAINDKANAEAALVDGFKRFPSSQILLLEMINFFLNNGEDASSVLPYLHKAQANEPNNASLFFAEGTLYEKLASEVKDKTKKVNEDINQKVKDRMALRKQAEALMSENEALRTEAVKLKQAKKAKESAAKLKEAEAKSLESDKLYKQSDLIASVDVPALNKKIDSINNDALKMIDDAERMYIKATSLNPKFFPAFYNLGALYYNKGTTSSQAASRVDAKDVAGYNRLMSEAEVFYKKALDPFKKAAELSPNDINTIETLKNIYFRFRNTSSEMMEMYKMYNDKVKSLK